MLSRKRKKEGEMSYITWVNKPPIVEITNSEEFQVLCVQFMRDIRTWKSPSESAEEVQGWNRRIDSGINIAGSAGARWTWGPNNLRFFIYKLLGKPVGLMVTREAKAGPLVTIKHLATHPGSENAGGILIEHAVNLSEQAGYNGCLKLTSLNRGSTAAYKALGFVEIEDLDIMKLVPNESDIWVRVENEWRLRKYKERRGFAGPASQPSTPWITIPASGFSKRRGKRT